MTPARAVFDAVTFIQSLANPNGPAAACWRRVQAGELIHFSSEDTLAELADVVARPKLAKRLAFAANSARVFIEAVRNGSTVLADVPLRFHYPRDPKDEPLVNLALAAGAKYLVTWDNDLLDLGNEGNAEGATLRVDAPGLTILTPPELLQVLRLAESNPVPSTPSIEE